eukprot:7771956-Ditylum_brightwellii.AAC.1
MREKLQVASGFKTTENEEDVMDLFKAIKSTLFRFDNKCNIYVVTANIISHFWHFYQSRDMTNIVYFENFKNLIDVAKEHGATLILH